MTTNETLRQWAHISPPMHIDPAKTALLLIDFQMEYYSGNLPLPDGDTAVANAARLMNFADQHHISVAHIAHNSTKTNSPLFAPGSSGVEFHPSVLPQPHHQVISKTLPSGFAKTNLHDWLQSHKITTLILTGLATHMCLAATTQEALSHGYQSIVVADATASRDLPSYDGKGFVPHHVMHQAALTMLSDRFADVFTTDDLMTLGIMAS